MEELKLSSWEDFEVAIASLFEKFDEVKKTADKDGKLVFAPIFRGHENASWRLETTLERYVTRQYAMREYYELMHLANRAVESYTEKSWNLNDEYERDENLPPQGYEFMIYLRHHGFPSPLLDWTQSPYVAAFFSFQSKAPSKDSNVAIYSYHPYSFDLIALETSKARIELLGPNVTADRRHYTQQSLYTICRKRDGNGYIYCNQEEGTGAGRGFFTKYVIPRSERSKVLKKLFLMNINSYSLFGNEESLMETLAYREIEEKYL